MTAHHSDRPDATPSTWRRPDAGLGGSAGYGRYIGRVGALAVALGIGVAVTTSTPGIALAAPADSGSATTSAADSPSSATGSSRRAATTKKSTPKSAAATGGVGSASTPSTAPTITTGHARTTGGPRRQAAQADSDSAAPVTQSSTPQATASATAIQPATQTGAAAATSVPAAATAPAAAITVAPAAAQTTSASATTSTPFRPVRALVAGVLTVFGYNPLATPVPGAPEPNPILAGIWGLYRRIESFIANETPTAGTPTVSTTLNSQGQITGTLNATDFDGDTLTYTIVQGQHGTAVVNADGSFTYTPVAGYTGTDTFEVKIADTGFHLHLHLFDLFHPTWHSTTETVTVVVPQVAPVITVVSGPSAPAADGSVHGTFTVVDLNREPVTVSVADGAEPAYGTVDFNYNATSGIYTWTYHPTQSEQISLGLNGTTLTDAFTISATDGHTDPVTAAVSNVTVAPAHLGLDAPIELGTRTGTSSVTVSTDGTRAYITNSGNATVMVVNLATGKVETTYDVDDYPIGIAAGSNGRIYVSNSDGHSISVIDTATGQTVTTIAVANAPGRPVLSPDGQRLYVPIYEDAIAVIDTASNTQISSINYVAGRLKFAGEDSTTLYAMGLDELAVIDTATGTVLDTIETADRAVDLAVSPDGTRVYIAAFLNGSVQVFDTSDPTDLAEVTLIAIPPAPSNFDNEPLSVTLSPDGSLAYVGTLGGKVFVVDTATNTLFAGATQQLPGKPDGFAVSPNGLHLYTVNDLHQTLAVITVKPGADVNESPFVTVVSAPSTPAADGTVSGSFRVTDPEGDATTVDVGVPTRGALTVTYNATSGIYSWTYKPTEAAQLVSGLGATALTDAFTVTVTDGTSTPGSLTISGITIAQEHWTVDSSIGAVSGKPSAVAISADGTLAYVTDKTQDSVAVVDLATGNVVHTYSVGDQPTTIAVHADGRIYVGYKGGVNVINPTSGDVKTLAISGGVRQVIVSPDGTRVYATKTGTVTPGIVVINTSTDTVTTTFGYTASYLAFAGNDSSKIYATDTAGLALAVLKASDGSLLGVTYVITDPGPLTVNAAGTRAYVTTPTAIKVYNISDPSHLSVVQTIALSSAPDAIALSPDGTLAYLSSAASGHITVVDLTAGSVLGTGTEVAGSHSGLALSADGTTIYATNTITHKLSVLTLNSGANINQAPVITEVQAPTAPTDTGVIYGSYVVADPDGEPTTVTNTVLPGKGAFLVDYDPVLGVYNWKYSPTQASQLISGLAATASTDGFSVNASDGTNSTVSVLNLTVPQAHLETGTGIATDGNPGGFFISADGTHGYVTDAGATDGDPNTVKVVDLSTGAVEAEYTVGSGPTSVVVRGDRIYVSNGGSDSVSIIDTTAGIVTTISVAGQPNALALSNNGERLYVTTDDGGIKVVDALAKTLLTDETIDLPSSDIALSADGALLYSLNRNGTISAIDTATGAVILQQPVNTAAAVVRRIALSPDGAHLYATFFTPGQSKVAVYDAATLTLTETLGLSDLPNGVAVSNDGSVVYVGGANGGLAIIDAATNTLIGTAPAVSSNSVADVVISPDGQHVYVVDTSSDQVIDLVVTPGGSLST